MDSVSSELSRKKLLSRCKSSEYMMQSHLSGASSSFKQPEDSVLEISLKNDSSNQSEYYAKKQKSNRSRRTGRINFKQGSVNMTNQSKNAGEIKRNKWQPNQKGSQHKMRSFRENSLVSKRARAVTDNSQIPPKVIRKLQTARDKRKTRHLTRAKSKTNDSSDISFNGIPEAMKVSSPMSSFH